MDKSAWANHLLKDEWFQEMMQELRSQEINKFALSDYDDAKERENAYIRLRTLDIVEDYLNGIITDNLIKEKRIKIL